jgi:hypothetical protein
MASSSLFMMQPPSNEITSSQSMNITPMTYMDGIQAEEEKGRLISPLRGVDSSIHTQHMARDNRRARTDAQ